MISEDFVLCKQFYFSIPIKVIYHPTALIVSDTLLMLKRAEPIKRDDYHFLYPNISYIFAKYDQKIIRTKRIERNEKIYCLFYWLGFHQLKIIEKNDDLKDILGRENE